MMAAAPSTTSNQHKKKKNTTTTTKKNKRSNRLSNFFSWSSRFAVAQAILARRHRHPPKQLANPSIAMSVRKRKKDSSVVLPEDDSQSIHETERELQSGRNEERLGKDHGIEMPDTIQDKGWEDINKAYANKENRYHKMEKTQLETDGSPSRNDQSGRVRMEVSELVLENTFVQPDQIPKVGKAERQEARSSARPKFTAQKNLQTRSSDHSSMRGKVWTPREEIILLSVIADIVRPGIGSTVNNADIDWNQLLEKVSQKLEGNVTRRQVYEKARRLKNKFSNVERKLNSGRFSTFKDANEEEAYRLYQQVWGSHGTLCLELEEEDDPALGTQKMEKSGHAVISHRFDHQGLEDAKTFQFTAKNESQASLGKNSSYESIVPFFKEHNAVLDEIYPNLKETPVEDREKELGSGAMKWDAERILEMVSSEYQAFLSKIRNSCQLALEAMQEKFEAMVSNAVKESANQVSPWMGGIHMSSFDNFQPATLGSADDFVGRYISSNRLECGKPTDESLHKQWQQQCLEELKLTSGRLRLLQEECHFQQEKIKREMIKNCKL